MQGEKVIVRALGDQPLVRRIWTASEKAVYICSEENYRLLIKGQLGLWPVGFPPEDVYQYDPQVESLLGGATEFEQALWERLIPWRTHTEHAAQQTAASA